ncbi:MAG: dockerin type I domain-containing protein, partial [Acutalibacteraceae bacterium]
APGYTTYTDKSFVLGTDKLPETIEIYAGDINGDNIINAKDSAILSAAFGTRKGSDGFNSNADLNGDGIINAKDKAILSANFTRRSVEVA